MIKIKMKKKYRRASNTVSITICNKLRSLITDLCSCFQDVNRFFFVKRIKKNNEENEKAL